MAKYKQDHGMQPNIKDFHTITAYLGKEDISGSTMASFKTGTINKGDIFFVCSDGVSDLITDEEKKKYMKNVITSHIISLLTQRQKEVSTKKH